MTNSIEIPNREEFLAKFPNKQDGFINTAKYANREMAHATIYKFCYNKNLPFISETHIGSFSRIRFIKSE